MRANRMGMNPVFHFGVFTPTEGHSTGATPLHPYHHEIMRSFPRRGPHKARQKRTEAFSLRSLSRRPFAMKRKAGPKTGYS